VSPTELLAILAPEFDLPAVPRTEFVEGLWSRLESELRPASPARGALRRSWRSWFAPIVRSPRRVAILVVLVLLFVSGVSMATYLGVKGWVATSPRGVQVRNDFHVTRVVAPSKALGWFWATALSTDGHDLYFVPDDGVIYRVRGVDSVHPSAPEPYFNPNSLLTRAFLGGHTWQNLATAPEGDLFVLGESSGWGGRRYPLSAAVVDLRPDGSHRSVVTYRELRDGGLLPGSVRTARGSGPLVGRNASFAISVPAAHRLWLFARISLHAQPVGGSPYDVAYYLVEVRDPNGDGDWSDRVVRRLRLPASVPGFDGRRASQWWYSPTSETAGGDAGSVLLSAARITDSPGGRRLATFRVYRIADRNGDGDLLDHREATKIYEGGEGAAVASRPDASAPEKRVLVLSRLDRISLVSADGRTKDIGRSFPATLQLLTGPGGDIYAVEQVGGTEAQVFRVAPGGGAGSPAVEMRPSPLHLPRSDAPMLTIDKTSASGRSTAWFRLDGSRAGAVSHHVGDVCRSTNGRVTAFTSDATIAHEPFVYIAPRRSGVPRKVTERALQPVCPFDGRHLVLSTARYVGTANVWTLAVYDVRTEAFFRVASGARDFAMSPNGQELVYVERGRHGGALVLVDLSSRQRTRLSRTRAATDVSPFAPWGGTRGDSLAWSANGQRIAFVTGPRLAPKELWSSDGSTFWPRHRYVVWVTSTEGRQARPVVVMNGGPPTLSWSKDGTKLLVCSAARGPYRGCQGTILPSSRGEFDESTLRLVYLSRPRYNRVVSIGDIAFAGWNPKRDEFAYADDIGVHLSSGRTIHGFAANGNWVGWSPDGRYIAMGEEDRYAIIDVTTGTRHEVDVDTQDVGASARWWP